MSTAEIRPLTLPELELLLDWAADEGWNPGFTDAEPFHAADPGGYFGCFINSRMAAGLSAVRYSDDFAFIGLYICHPDFRGKGHGRRLWDHGMQHLGNRTIGLDGVPAQQDNYARMGFVPAYRTWRWSGRFPALPTAGSDVILLTPEHRDVVASLDARAFPAPRPAFLQAWCRTPHVALAIERKGEIDAYGVMRRCREGFKIGPLFAENDADAERLFSALARRAGDAVIAIDVPETQASFANHLSGLGFSEGFVTARMYKGAPPRLEGRLVYGVTTLELG
jgi:GNAT superfamily N-acetyltransferase